jgi:hypothetical protein
MILRDKLNDYQSTIGWGQLFFLSGALSAGLAGDNPMGKILLNLFTDGPLPPAVQGFAAGLSVALIATSIVLNLRGLRMYRAEKDGGS